jgi:hypothetical protein
VVQFATITRDEGRTVNGEAVQLFSIGHSNAPIERFIAQRANGMCSAADYRTFAGRRLAAPGIVEP